MTLAVGIATNTAIFAIVDEIALKPARGPADPHVYYATNARYGVQIADYELLRANLPAGITAITPYDTFGGGLAQIPGRAERLQGWRVGGEYARVLAARAQVGRWIDNDDNAGGELDPSTRIGGISRMRVRGRLGTDVAVISDRLWREWFDGDRRVVERGTIFVDRQPKRIIGVAPPEFEPKIDIWLPFGSRRLLTRDELEATRPKRNPFDRVVRPVEEPRQPTIDVMLRSDGRASREELSARLTAAVSLRPASSDMPKGPIRLTPRGGDDRLLRTGYVILGFAALVFVAACANLGNMLYARATEREGDMATRLALGASQMDIFRLLFSEAVLISGAAALAGVVLAAGAVELFADAVPAFQTNSWTTVRLDLRLNWTIFVFAAGAGAVAALVVGAGSLWRSSRASLLARISAAGPAVIAKTEGRTLRTMLVAVQVTAAVVLLVATGLLLENSSKQLDRRLTFDTDSLVAARIELPDNYDESRGTHYFERLLEKVRAIDGVSSAALTDALPAGEAPAPRRGPGAIIGELRQQPLSGMPTRLDGAWIYTSPGFIDTLGLSLVGGRDLRALDVAGTDPVALVSTSIATRLWPGENAVGKRFTCCREAYLRTVVGVVSHPVVSKNTAQAMDVSTAMENLTAGTGVGHYVLLPAAQHYRPDMLLVIRSARPDMAIPRLRQIVAELDAAVPLFAAGPAHATQFVRASSERAVRTLAGTLGLVAFAISLFGVFAVVSYFVTQRSREFGLRLALGATRAQVMKLVVDHAIRMVLIGLLPGVLFASLGTRFFQAELQKLRPNGLTMWIAVPAVMLAAAIIAAWLPARRAARVDPYRTLKDN